MALPICVKEQIFLLRILPSSAQTLRLLYWEHGFERHLAMDVFPRFSWVLVLTFVHVFRALDRTTSQRFSCQVFFFLEVYINIYLRLYTTIFHNSE